MPTPIKEEFNPAYRPLIPSPLTILVAAATSDYFPDIACKTSLLSLLISFSSAFTTRAILNTHLLRMLGRFDSCSSTDRHKRVGGRHSNHSTSPTSASMDEWVVGHIDKMLSRFPWRGTKTKDELRERTRTVLKIGFERLMVLDRRRTIPPRLWKMPVCPGWHY